MENILRLHKYYLNKCWNTSTPNQWVAKPYILYILTKNTKDKVMETNDLTFSNFPKFPTAHIKCSYV